jgi:hypothetical protein
MQRITKISSRSHRLKKVREIIAKAMILRLLLMTVYKKSYILCAGYYGSGLKSANKEKRYIVQTNCHASTGKSHDKC